MGQNTRKAFAGEARAVGVLSAAKAVWWAANGLLVRRMVRPGMAGATRPVASASPRPGMAVLRREWLTAFAKDARDVASGLYPRTEAAPRSLSQPFERAADLLVDARAVDQRRRRGGGGEARGEPGAESYPSYYRQNFHYQSGGWLTEESARRYEAQVEALFTGAAGAMRRRALSLLAKAWRERDQRGLVLLDLACGSGAFLADLKAAFPRAQVIGLDLSAPYLAEAGRRVRAVRVQGAAERLPFADASLDGVSCIYLFHELPPKVRRQAAAEIARVLKPGGVLAFADSVQAQDAPQIARLLEAFPAFFHEPYYDSYQACDLDALFEGAGLKRLDADQAFLTKALLFAKAEGAHTNRSI
jgi:ubiquinone/menaquinone biosynthesis C-methylase UbiE